MSTVNSFLSKFKSAFRRFWLNSPELTLSGGLGTCPQIYSLTTFRPYARLCICRLWTYVAKGRHRNAPMIAPSDIAVENGTHYRLLHGRALLSRSSAIREICTAQLAPAAGNQRLRCSGIRPKSCSNSSASAALMVSRAF